MSRRHAEARLPCGPGTGCLNVGDAGEEEACDTESTHPLPTRHCCGLASCCSSRRGLATRPCSNAGGALLCYDCYELCEAQAQAVRRASWSCADNSDHWRCVSFLLARPRTEQGGEDLHAKSHGGRTGWSRPSVEGARHPRGCFSINSNGWTLKGEALPRSLRQTALARLVTLRPPASRGAAPPKRPALSIEP